MLQDLMTVKCATDARRLTRHAIASEDRKGIMKDIEETCLAKKFNGIYVLEPGETIKDIISSLKRIGFNAYSIYYGNTQHAADHKHNAVVVSW